MSKMRTSLSKIIDYPAYLDKCWQEHLQEKPNAPTVISTFAGCGGSSLGYSMAGFHELLAIEWDDNAVETFKLNFPDVPVYHGDIAKISVGQVLETTGLKPGELDILDGSPPCQGFSTAGKRILDDPRNQLFKEFARLLNGLQPKVFVMENVSGMVKGKMKLLFAEILRELKASGYKVSTKLLNAMYFGVPQSRQRLIFIGVREDLGIAPSHPDAENVPVTVKEAWDNIKNVMPPKLSPFILPYINKMTEGMSMRDAGYNGGFQTKRIYWNKPSPTLTKIIGGVGFGTNLHPEENRVLSIPETKLCGAFPDDFEFIGEYKYQRALIGNSVPPLFMRSIAKHIRVNILDRLSTISEEPVLLGNSSD
jgi:DNA (cytosine-5)-methyltransferase 1